MRRPANPLHARLRFTTRNESPLTHWDGPLVIGGIDNDDSHPCTSVLAANAVGNKVFIVGEKLATLRMVLEKHGIDVSRCCPMSNFGRRNVSAEATAMMQDLVTVRPCLLWLQWSVLLTEPGRRSQVRTALEFFSGLVEKQLQLGGDVLLEARSCDVPIHDELFNAPRRLGQILNKPQRVTWCSLNSKGGSRGETLLCGEHLVMSNREFPPGPCVCQRQSSTYGSTSGEGYEQFCGKMLLHFAHLADSASKPTMTSSAAGHADEDRCERFCAILFSTSTKNINTNGLCRLRPRY